MFAAVLFLKTVEQSAATEEVMASAEHMSAQVEEMSAQAQGLAATAGHLKNLITRFRLDDDEPDEPVTNVRPLRASHEDFIATSST